MPVRNNPLSRGVEEGVCASVEKERAANRILRQPLILSGLVLRNKVHTHIDTDVIFRSNDIQSVVTSLQFARTVE